MKCTVQSVRQDPMDAGDVSLITTITLEHIETGVRPYQRLVTNFTQ